MATGKSGYFDLTGSDASFSMRINWSETYEITTNKSVVTITSVQVKSTGWYGYTYFPDGVIKINGITAIAMESGSGDYGAVVRTLGEWYTILKDGAPVTGSVEVSHNTDGSKSVSIEVAGNRYSKCYFYTASGSGGSGWYVVDSKTIELTNISRASSLLLSTTNVDVGDTIDVSIIRTSSSFTHTVEFYINSTYYKSYEAVGASQSFTIPNSWYNAMPSSTSCTAYCRVTTFNGNTQIGDQVRKSFTVNVPNNIVPTVGTITLDPMDINNNNILVKGKNSLKISVSDCSAGVGSSIKSYTFSGPSLTETTTTNTYITVPSVVSINTLVYTVKVTDKRGRTASKTESIVCYDYYSPSFISFNAYRANADGSENVNGAYLKCTYQSKYAPVNSTNDITVTMYYNGESKVISDGSELIDLNGDVDTTYKVYLKIVDTYGGIGTSDSITIFGQTRILNITPDGTGIAIGKKAESVKLFECRWDAKFNGDINCNNIMINQKSIFDLIYPIGSVYMSVNDSDTCDIVFGTWVKLNASAITGVYMWERIE
jgi:hypothetical protein